MKGFVSNYRKKKGGHGHFGLNQNTDEDVNSTKEIQRQTLLLQYTTCVNIIAHHLLCQESAIRLYLLKVDGITAMSATDTDIDV